MKLLKKLMEAHGPSGDEAAVREIIKKELKGYVDELYTDKFGNLVARKKGKGPTVMLVAHMDEIGIMVKNVDYNGRIYISPIGGIEPITLLGETVCIKTRKGDDLHGIITTKEIQDSTELTVLPNMSDLYIDTGLTAQETERLDIRTGDYISLLQEYREIGNGRYVCGKAIDDRFGCFVLVEIAKKLKKVKGDVYFVFTVQEEIGLYGAKTSVYSIDPDYAIILDVTESDDGRARHPTKCVGKGPILLIKDAEMITNKCMNEWFFDIAKKNDFCIQTEIIDFGTTDALSISASKGGVPCTVLGVPVRNIHTTTSIASVDDILSTVDLLHLFLKNPPKTCI